MRICIKLSEVPESIRDEVSRLGIIRGERVDIDTTTFNRLVKTVPIKSNEIKGLGDIIHKLAQPIAKAIDKAIGTQIQGCGGCKKRREKLNKAFPL